MPPDRGQGPAGLALRRGLGGEGPVRAGPASAGPRPGQHKLVNCKLTCIPQRTENPNRGHTHRTSNMRTQGILQGYGWRPCGRGGMADAPGLGPGPFGGGGSTPLARTRKLPGERENGDQQAGSGWSAFRQPVRLLCDFFSTSFSIELANPLSTIMVLGRPGVPALQARTGLSRPPFGASPHREPDLWSRRGNRQGRIPTGVSSRPL